MAHLLVPHAATPAASALTISAGARRGPDGVLALAFTVAGAIDRLSIPDPARPERTDGLWQHTCFEAFVGPGEGARYREFNLSPSGQWAAYRFDDYRTGLADAEAPPPGIRFRREPDRLVLEATLAGLPAEGVWHVGLSAVIEERDGTKTYWALRHPPGKPDFHHRDCFALELPPPA